jgi:proliferating cell nuclear antigen
MKMVMKDAKLWKTCVSAVSSLIEDAAFVVSPSGLKLRAMDPSHIALVDLELPPQAFEEFSVEKQTTIGIHIPEMVKVVSRAKPSERLTIELDESTNRLNLTFAGPPVRRLSMPTIDAQDANYPEPKLIFTAAMEVPADLIQDGIKDAELIGDSVEFEAVKEGLRMRAESDKGASELVLDVGSDALTNFTANPPARARYAISYLNSILSNSPPGLIGVKLGTDLPVSITYPIPSGKLMFLLAPRVGGYEPPKASESGTTETA